jgi:hypothetical protein
MEDFNLKKFLVENKLTTNSKMINEEITKDSPLFKNLVVKVQQISDESGNDYALKAYLKGKYAMFDTYTTGPSASCLRSFIEVLELTIMVE